MARRAHDPIHWLSELEAPLLDLSGGETVQILLERLKTQNGALDRLRWGLALEERLNSHGVRVAEAI